MPFFSGAYSRPPEMMPGDLWEAGSSVGDPGQFWYIADNLNQLLSKRLLNPATRRLRDIVLTADRRAIHIMNIPQTYRGLDLVISGRVRSPGSFLAVYLNVNQDATLGKYARQYVSCLNTTVSIVGVTSSTSIVLGGLPGDDADQNVSGSISCRVMGYASSLFWKPFLMESGSFISDSEIRHQSQNSTWMSQDPITSISLSVGGSSDGRFLAGTSISLYGLF